MLKNRQKRTNVVLDNQSIMNVTGGYMESQQPND